MGVGDGRSDVPLWVHSGSFVGLEAISHCGPYIPKRRIPRLNPQ